MTPVIRKFIASFWHRIYRMASFTQHRNE